MAEASLEGSGNAAGLSYAQCKSCILHCSAAQCGAVAHLGLPG